MVTRAVARRRRADRRSVGLYARARHADARRRQQPAIAQEHIGQPVRVARDERGRRAREHDERSIP